MTQLRLCAKFEDLRRAPNDLCLKLLLAHCHDTIAVETVEVIVGKVEDSIERSQLLVGHRPDQQLDVLVLSFEFLVRQNMAHVSHDKQLAARAFEGPCLDFNLESLRFVRRAP